MLVYEHRNSKLLSFINYLMLKFSKMVNFVKLNLVTYLLYNYWFSFIASED